MCPCYSIKTARCYQLTLFACLKSLFSKHQLNFAGYSLGEVVAFLASSGATPAEIGQTLLFRTGLMTSLLGHHASPAYDLLYLHGVFNVEEMNALCAEHNCYIAIVNSEQQLVIGGTVPDLKALLIRLDDKHLLKTKFLGVHLPSHTPFYAKQRGLFCQFLNKSSASSLCYPMLSPITLGKRVSSKRRKRIARPSIIHLLAMAESV